MLHSMEPFVRRSAKQAKERPLISRQRAFPWPQFTPYVDRVDYRHVVKSDVARWFQFQKCSRHLTKALPIKIPANSESYSPTICCSLLQEEL